MYFEKSVLKMEKTEIAFRKATEKDIKAVYDLICDMEAKQLDYDSFAIIFNKQLADDDYYCLLCTEELTEKGGADGCAVIGELNLRFEDQLHHAGRIAEIMEFCIAAFFSSSVSASASTLSSSICFSSSSSISLRYASCTFLYSRMIDNHGNPGMLL